MSSPFEGLQSCLKSLREQMSDLQSQVYEHAKSSSTWKYKLGFSCEKCDMKWEIEHHVNDIDTSAEGSIIDIGLMKPVPKCTCNQTKLTTISDQLN